MRILFVLYSLSAGGAERVTVNLANYWAGLGFKVTIVTLASKETDAYALSNEVRRVSLELAGISANSLIAVINNGLRIRALRRLLHGEKPDVVIGMMARSNCLLALAGVPAGCVAIGVEHTYPPAANLGFIWQRLRRHSYRWLDAVVSLTDQGTAWIEEHTHARHVATIANPVMYPLPRNEPFVPPDRYLKPDRKTLISVGRLEVNKGFARSIRAFARIAHEFPDWQYVILGQGALRGELENLVSQLSMQDQIYLVGQAGNVGDWYTAADAYIMASLVEGFPNVLIEAMAHGLPVLSVDCLTGPREIIRHRENGMLVPQDDPEALREGLSELMSNGVLRRNLASAATEVSEHLSLAKIATEWEDLFASFAKGSGKLH